MVKRGAQKRHGLHTHLSMTSVSRIQGSTIASPNMPEEALCFGSEKEVC